MTNIARGDVIDDAALVAALGTGHVAAAGLDVFAGEPAVHPAYRTLPNVFGLPHIGSATMQTRVAIGAPSGGQPGGGAGGRYAVENRLV